jgi:hypothetical protein
VQRVCRIDAAKVALAGAHTPRFIADIDEYIVAACETVDISEFCS